MQDRPELITVTIAVDRWVGRDLTSSIIGAWSTSHTFRAGSIADVLDHCRDALGSRWQPASPSDIERAMNARRTQSTPWDQISLF